MSVKFTDAQLVMLSAATQREDLCLNAPDKMKGAVLAKVSEKLAKLGLVREVRAKAGMPAWRQDDAGRSYALKLTAAGSKAIAIDGSEDAIARRGARQRKLQPVAEGPKDPAAAVVDEHAKRRAPRDGSKLARVIDLLQRSEGATIPNLTEATGWLAHTTRAALTGLRKRGYAVARERVDGDNSIYRAAGCPTPFEGRSLIEPKASERDRRELEPKANQMAGSVWLRSQPVHDKRRGGRQAGDRCFAAARCFSALDRGAS